MGSNIDVYTDGSCINNPGPGAYSYVILKSGNVLHKFSCGFLHTTNNRMELLAVIEALIYIKSNCDVLSEINIFSDSKYVTDTFNKQWINVWERRNFKGVLNIDLWKRYLKIAEGLKIKHIWVEGHSGNFYNEECNRNAINEAKHGTLIVDEGYLQNNSSLF